MLDARRAFVSPPSFASRSSWLPALVLALVLSLAGAAAGPAAAAPTGEAAAGAPAAPAAAAPYAPAASAPAGTAPEAPAAPPEATLPNAATQGSLGTPPTVPPASLEGMAGAGVPGATPPGAAAPTTPTAPAAAAPAPATPTAPAPPAAPSGPPGAGPGRINFQLSFPAERGGGSAAGSAVNLDYKNEDYAVLTGKVRVRYQDIELQADRAEIDLRTKQVVAQGNVIIDQGPKRLTGNTATFDLESKTGKVLEATAFVAPDYYFSGAEIDKTGDDTYTVLDGIFTTCSQTTPDWSFRLARAEVEVEGYAHIRNGTLRAKNLPLLYTPYLLWPVKKERASGFLIPAVHYSRVRGGAINLAYFQTLGDSYDATFHLEPFFRGGLGLGSEFRYHPTRGTVGDLVGFFINDPVTKTNRWKIQLDHDTEDLPLGMRGVVHYENFSDLNYFRDFERDFDRSTLRFFDSRAFVTGNWGPNLLNFLINDRKSFVNTAPNVFVTTVVQRKLPELSYSLRSTRLWSTPLYLELESSAAYLDLTRTGVYAGQYGRFDLFPQMTLPIHTVPWLSVSVTGGDRFTYYGARVATDPATGQLSLAKQSLLRNLPLGSAEMIGPSFSRIFNLKLGEFTKFKHLIQPRITYTYQGSFQRAPEVPLFDEIDTPALSNSVRVALQNRLLGKPAGEAASAREVFYFELARNYSFDPNQPLELSADGKVKSQAGPLEGLLRLNATQRSNFQAQALYSTLFHHLASISVSANTSFANGNAVGVTWFVRYLPTLIQSSGTGSQTFQAVRLTGNQIRVNGQLGILKDRLALQAGIAYDVQNHLLQQQFYAFNWTSQCYGFRLELRDFRTVAGVTRNDRDIRFSLTLKGVGTLLDINSRSTTVAP